MQGRNVLKEGRVWPGKEETLREREEETLETYLNFVYWNFEDVYGGMTGLDQTELGLMDSIYRGMRVGTNVYWKGIG